MPISTGAKWGTATLLVAGIFLGIVLWGGFNTAMEATNTETFCVSCHEMNDTVYQELQDTIHFTNRTGMRATCPDCHVPKEWVHKLVRKVQATSELYHKWKGTIDTPEKFEAHRLELAQSVWGAMKSTDSRECRNCHDYESMDFDRQESRSSDRHDVAFEKGYTCIDCHKGISHALPEGYDPADDLPPEDEE